LHRFIDFQNQYGNELETEMQRILHESEHNGSEEHEQQLEEELELLLDKEAVSWLTYWSGHDFFELYDQCNENIVPLLFQYRLLRQLLKNNDNEATFPYTTKWNGDTWVIPDHEMTPENEMSFNEIITSKEIMRMLSTVDGGKWLSLRYLSAVFFRKEGELFTDKLVYEKGERLKLLDELPLSIALDVAFFLISSMSLWRNNLPYLASREQMSSLN
jgi:hypothetical protein